MAAQVSTERLRMNYYASSFLGYIQSCDEQSCKHIFVYMCKNISGYIFKTGIAGSKQLFFFLYFYCHVTFQQLFLKNPVYIKKISTWTNVL